MDGSKLSLRSMVGSFPFLTKLAHDIYGKVGSPKIFIANSNIQFWGMIEIK